MAVDSAKLGENICEAIGIISKSAVQSIQCDKTIVCTIIDNSKKDLGYYTVAEGNTEFVASNNGATNYKIGDQVQVTIPQGDYSRQKVIIGKYTADDQNIPVAYVSPLETVVSMTNNILEKPKSTAEFALLANGNKTSEVLYERVFNDEDSLEMVNNKTFTSLALSAKFQCLMAERAVVQGNYGLRLTLTYTLLDDPLKTSVYNTTLDVADMIGNPYAFTAYFKQEKKIDITNLGNIKSIIITFFQDKNFIEFDGTSNVLIDPYEKIQIGTNSLGQPVYKIIEDEKNIFVKDILLTFGNDLLLIPDNTFQIFTNDPDTYAKTKALAGQKNYGEKILQSIWYNKDKEEQFIGFTDGVVPVNHENKEIDYDEYAYIKESEKRMAGASIIIPESDNIEIPRLTETLQIYSDAETINSTLQTFYDSLVNEFPNVLTNLAENVVAPLKGGDDNAELVPNADPLLDEILSKINEFTLQGGYLDQFYDAISVIGDLKPSDRAVSSPKPLIILYNDILYKYSEIYNQLSKDINSNISKLVEDGQDIKDKIDPMYQDFYTFWNDVFLNQCSILMIDYIKNNLFDKYPTMQPSLQMIEKTYNQLLEKWNKIIIKLEELEENQNNSYDNLKLKLGTSNTAERNLISFEDEYNEFLEKYKNHYCIYWYRYRSGYEDSDDKYLPKNWERLLNPGRDENGQIVIPTKETPQEIIDALIPLNPKPGMPAVNQTTMTYMPKSTQPFPAIQMDYKKEAEKFKAVLIYNHQPYFSNEITFTNEEPELDSSLTNTISIELSDNAKDAYPLYDSNGKLSIAETNVQRRLQVKYNSIDNSNEPLRGAWVYWYIPNANSMLSYSPTVLQNYGFTYLNTDPKQSNLFRDHLPHQKNGYDCYFKRIGDYSIPEEGEPAPTLNEEDTYFYFTLYNQYSSSRMNNTIKCKIVTNTTQLEDDRYFTFNNLGTAGTEYTLSVKPTSQQCALINSHNEIKPLEMRAAFYDYYGAEITDETAPVVVWGWMDGAPNKGLQIVDSDKGNNYKELTGNIDLNYMNQCHYNILQCSVQWNKIAQDEATGGDIVSDQPMTLKAYYPMPFSTGDYYIDGPTTVIYNDLGKDPQFNKSPYRIFNASNNTEITNDIAWTIIYYSKNGVLGGSFDGQEDRLGLPTLSTREAENSPKQYFLSPAVMYLSNQTLYPVVLCTQGGQLLWSQPILITQNRYGSTFLNNWDESLKIDEENNVIMSAMMGAGYKDNENRFHGVVMGDVRTKLGNENITTTGLYGFHANEQAFGLKVDGTAFFGKSGHGRILIDGNKSTLESESWASAGYGMQLDLDDGILQIKGDTASSGGKSSGIILSDGTRHIDPEDPTQIEYIPYLQIDSASGTRLLNIGKVLTGEGEDDPVENNSYYLQSDGYRKSQWVKPTVDGEAVDTTFEPGQGVFFDLERGLLRGYNFTFESECSEEAHAGSFIKINSDPNKFLQVFYQDNTIIDPDTDTPFVVDKIMHVGLDNFSFHSFDWDPYHFDNTGTLSPVGTEIDMECGRFLAYSNLGKTSIDGPDYRNCGICIDADGDKPFRVGYNVRSADPAFYINWDGSFGLAKGVFSVSAAGHIYAEAGTIGGWQLNPGSISSVNQGTKIILNSSGSISASGTGGSYNMNANGKLTAKDAEFDNIKVLNSALFTNSCTTTISGKLLVNCGTSGGTATVADAPAASYDIETGGACKIGGKLTVSAATEVTGAFTITGEKSSFNLATNDFTVGGAKAWGDSSTILVDVPFEKGKYITISNGIITDVKDAGESGPLSKTLQKLFGLNGDTSVPTAEELGDLAFLDKVVVSSATFKVGSSSGSCTISASGDTATMSFTVPAQSRTIYFGHRTVIDGNDVSVKSGVADSYSNLVTVVGGTPSAWDSGSVGFPAQSASVTATVEAQSD